MCARQHEIKGEVPFKAPLTGIFGVDEDIITPVIGPDGEVEIIAGTTRDVTERKRAEQTLDAERMRWRGVVEGIADEDILYSDGRPRPPEQGPLLISLRTGEVVRGDEIMRHRASGRCRHQQFSCAPMRDAGGAVTGAVAIVRVITAYKDTEDALRAANDKLREAGSSTTSST